MSGKDRPEAFLNVQSSASGQRWVQRLSPSEQNTAIAIAQTLDIPELVGRVMAGRGVTLDTAQEFLNPAIRNLMPDPDVLTDMDVVTDRIAAAIKSDESVAIFGDYDVDGACASALMFRFLAEHGQNPRIYIPDRIFEGYGPNPDAIRELAQGGATLIITVDCGATSFEALEEAAKLGVDVVVLDHHQMGPETPKSVGLVNPNRQDDLSGLGYLCAAGVVFITLASVIRKLRKEGFYGDTLEPPDLLSWLDLVALATVCDVVPLQGLNRAFVIKGLQVMARQQNAGLKALMRVGRLDGPPRTYHLGFVLGPRINAGGRIGDAALGSRLLTTDDEHLATEIAEQLEMLNQERQRAEKQMLEQAIAEADAEVSQRKRTRSSRYRERGLASWNCGTSRLQAERPVQKASVCHCIRQFRERIRFRPFHKRSRPWSSGSRRCRCWLVRERGRSCDGGRPDRDERQAGRTARIF